MVGKDIEAKITPYNSTPPVPTRKIIFLNFLYDSFEYLDNPKLHKIEKWHQDDVISELWKKYYHSKDYHSHDIELLPKNKNQKLRWKAVDATEDGLIISMARQYRLTLITERDDTLSTAEKLKDEEGITVFSLEQAIEYVEQKIRERDDYARQYAEEMNTLLPEWVDKD